MLDTPLRRQHPFEIAARQRVARDARELAPAITNDVEPRAIRQPGTGEQRKLRLVRQDLVYLAARGIQQPEVLVGVAAHVHDAEIAAVRRPVGREVVAPIGQHALHAPALQLAHKHV